MMFATVKRALLAATLATAPAFAQAQAQGDIATDWRPTLGQAFFSEDEFERWDGSDVGDFAALPLNDAARMRSDTWDASMLTIPERQCIRHPSTYAMRGPILPLMRISAEYGPLDEQLRAYHLSGTFRRADRVIWMDGRPHPPQYAQHTWAGFSTGKWYGYQLQVETSHVKTGYFRRNGVAHSDRIKMTEYFRRTGDYLTVTRILVDPVYLTEPMINTIDFQQVANPGQTRMFIQDCIPTAEVATDRNHVPYHLPGQNPALREFAERMNLPLEAVRGHAESLYPEYMIKLRELAGQTVLTPR